MYKSQRRNAVANDTFVRHPRYTRLGIEPLEGRRMLAVITVDTDQDVIASEDDLTSLREAIATTNALPGPDEIVFDFGHDGPATILLKHGELRITDELTITGDGPDVLSIDAQKESRIFNITMANGDVTIVGMKMNGGKTTGNNSNSEDSTFNGGAIRSLSTGLLTIESSTITGNEVQGSGAKGGGVFARGAVRVDSSTISNNTAIVGGGIYGRYVSVSRSTVSDNTVSVGTGGGIYSLGTLEVASSTISDNAAHDAGGIYGNNVIVTASTLSGNSVHGDESSVGGAYGNTVSITASFIAGNSCNGVDGGNVTVTSSTISANDGSGVSGNIVSAKSSTIVDNLAMGVLGEHLTIANSVVARNGVSDISLAPFATAPNIKYSLIGDNSGTNIAESPDGQPDANGNLIGGPINGVIDPMLGPLADNGGPTWTHALLPDSPAIDMGDPSAMAGVDDTPLYDQRGEAYGRVMGGTIDMGAHERQNLTVDIIDAASPTLTPVHEVTIQFSSPVTGFDLDDLKLSRNRSSENLLTGGETLSTADNQAFVVGNLSDLTGASGYYSLQLISSASDIVDASDDPLDSGDSMGWRVGPELIVDTIVDEADGSLDDDISLRDAIAAAAPGETISFEPSLDGGTIMLTLGEIAIPYALEIDASELAAGLTVDASGSDPTPEEDNGDGSRVFHVDDGNELSDSPVTLRGLTLTGGDVGRNYRGRGGAILSRETLSVANSVISGNSAGVGGGIRGVNVTVDSCTISANSAGLGGGISGSNVTVASSVISDNSAGFKYASGGGVHGNNVIVTDSKVSNNSVDGWGSAGGGIRGDNVTVADSTISGNSVSGNYISGGGIFGGSVLVTNSAILGNSVIGWSAPGGIRGTDVTVDASTISANDGNGVSGNIVSVTSSTIVDNLAGGIVGGDVTVANSIVSRLDADALTVEYSLIAVNSGTDLSEAPLGQPDANGNLVGGPIHGIIDPLLGPLADNGGSKLTHALLSGSPAIDAGNPSAMAGVDDTPLYDQRGEAYGRVIGGRIDMGAHERQNLTVDIIDAASPTLTPVDEVTIQFSGPVAGFDLDDLALSLNRTGENLLTGGESLTTADDQTFVLGNLSGLMTASDYYTLQLIAPESDIVDADGGPLDGGDSMLWRMGRAIIVDTLLDEMDGSLDDDVSLRDAIAAAAPGETITFESSLDGGTLLLTLGEMTIPYALKIDASGLAAGLTIDASGNDPTPQDDNGDGSRIFHIDDGDRILDSPVTLRGLTLTGGDVNESGGAIRSRETLYVADSTISGNSTNDNGGGNYGHNGGGICGSRVTVTLSSISSNGGDGVEGVDVTLNSTTIAGNSGHGIDGGHVTVILSTIAGNADSGIESGIHGAIDVGHVIVASSTIADNLAGGIGGPDVTVANSIVSRLNADALTVEYSLITDNSETDLAEAPVGQPDTNGNLIGGPTHGVIDPMLGPLADNGGPTLTHALSPGSPAINMGDPNAMHGDFDQRGWPFTRVHSGRIDIGAFELQPLPADFDENGLVSGSDFLALQRGYGTPDATKTDGDADGDLDVDRDDLSIWESTFGLAQPAVALVSASQGAAELSISYVEMPQSTGRSSYATPIRRQHIDLAIGQVERREQLLPLVINEPDATGLWDGVTEVDRQADASTDGALGAVAKAKLIPSLVEMPTNEVRPTYRPLARRNWETAGATYRDVVLRDYAFTAEPELESSDVAMAPPIEEGRRSADEEKEAADLALADYLVLL